MGRKNAQRRTSDTKYDRRAELNLPESGGETKVRVLDWDGGMRRENQEPISDDWLKLVIQDL